MARLEGVSEVRRVTKRNAGGGGGNFLLTRGTQEMLNSVFKNSEDMGQEGKAG